MKIVRVNSDRHVRYIPLKGWDNVQAALEIYAQGRTKGSDATATEQIRALGETHGGLAVASYLLASSDMGTRSQLVDQMLAEAKAVLSERDNWSRSFDYNGMGTRFFKTSVDILIIDRQQDIYGLGIHAAYVGSEPEAHLADYLGIPQALMVSDVTIEVEPSGTDCFAFDFEQIVRTLDAVLRTNGICGKTIAQAMMKLGKNHSYKESCAEFTLYREAGFQVRIFPVMVGSRFVWHDPQGPERRQLDMWRVEGATLHGLLADSYQEEGKKKSPTFSISLSDYKGRYDVSPIWRPEIKERIYTLTNQILTVFQ